jgi:hypothetical protein
MKSKINFPSVRKSTQTSNSRQVQKRIPDIPTSTPEKLESDISLKANKNASSAPPPLKTLNSLMHDDGQDPSSVVTSSSSKRSRTAEDFGTPEWDWYGKLSALFLEAGKGLPTRKQAADAHSATTPHQTAFLAWLPTSEQFKQTKHAGGLANLVQFFPRPTEQKPAEPLPPPCAKCRDSGLPGYIRRTLVKFTGVFKGTRYDELAPCDCKLGRAIAAGISREEQEYRSSRSRSPVADFRNSKEVLEELPGTEIE